MKKDTFRIMFDLLLIQPWLIDKQEVLEHLLYKECSSHKARELLIELIKRFEFLDNDRYQILMRQIAREIVADPHLHEQSTLIAAMSVGSGADSGQAIIYSLKTLLPEQKWWKHTLVNDALHAFKTFTRNAPLKDIILVDEFIGTGQTVIGRVKTIQAQFSGSKIEDFTIQVKVLAATEAGIKNIEAEGIKITAQVIIKKGITDYYNEQAAEEKKQVMLKLEGILSKDFSGREMPTMGYGQAEALYYRKDTNLPNSVFPIFWWAEYSNKKPRDTLLIRSMRDA